MVFNTKFYLHVTTVLNICPIPCFELFEEYSTTTSVQHDLGEQQSRRVYKQVHQRLQREMYALGRHQRIESPTHTDSKNPSLVPKVPHRDCPILSLHQIEIRKLQVHENSIRPMESQTGRCLCPPFHPTTGQVMVQQGQDGSGQPVQVQLVQANCRHRRTEKKLKSLLRIYLSIYLSFCIFYRSLF